jgi:hypothetical protein
MARTAERDQPPPRGPHSQPPCLRRFQRRHVAGDPVPHPTLHDRDRRSLRVHQPLAAAVTSSSSFYNAGSRAWPAERAPTCCSGSPSSSTPRRPSAAPRLAPGRPAAGRPGRRRPTPRSRARPARTAAVCLTTRSEVRRRQIPPDGYPGFKQAMDAVADWRDQTLPLHPGGQVMAPCLRNAAAAILLLTWALTIPSASPATAGAMGESLGHDLDALWVEARPATTSPRWTRSTCWRAAR